MFFSSINRALIRWRKIEKAHDQMELPVFDQCEITTAKDRRAIGFRKRETPSPVVAKAVDFGSATDTRLRKSLLNAGNDVNYRFTTFNLSVRRTKFASFRPNLFS